MNDIMIDIETLGTGPFSHILSIAAVKFDRRTGEKNGHLYSLIEPQSCQNLGLLIDASTVLWWMEQPDVSRNEFTREDVNRIAIVPALESLSEFISSAGDGVNIWANSPAFDCCRIREAYQLTTFLKAPWSYKQERDYRTVMSLYTGDFPEKSYVPHNALEDCFHQIDKLVIALKGLSE